MAFVKGKSGNPGGRSTEKPWREALMRAVKRRVAGDEQALERVADAVVAAAMGGDISAAKEIGDRLDGKPRQEIEATVEQTNYVIRAPEVAESTEAWKAQFRPETVQ